MGFLRVASAIPKVRVADCRFNVKQIKDLIRKAEKEDVQILCFPELSITAYTCADLFFQQNLYVEAEEAVFNLLFDTETLEMTFIIGCPVFHNSKLYNCAVVCREGKIQGIVPKTYLPNYQEFYEKRWFEPWKAGTPNTIVLYAGQDVPFGTDLLFENSIGFFAVEICEDVWSVVPPSSYHAMAGAELIFNLSASDELIGKRPYVKSLLSQQSARCIAAYVYSAAGFGESSTDVVYSGNAYIYENGRLLCESERFSMDEQLLITDIDIGLLKSERRKNTTFVGLASPCNYKKIINDEDECAMPPHSFSPDDLKYRKVDPTPFVPATENYNESCEEIFSIQVSGLAKRTLHANAKTLVIGVSGGLDSTLALLVCAKTADKLGLPRTMILGVTMPGFGTTNRTYDNAMSLMRSLGVTIREISIVPACEQHFKDIDHSPDIHDVTYENSQARERTQILMDLANKTGGIVVGTGDMSELALGWATYAGDHISMYGVNSGIPKTLVRHLISWVADNRIDPAAGATLRDILDTPVSPELLPVDVNGQMTQFTEDVVGPYALHDFFLYYMLRYGFASDKIFSLACRAFDKTYDEATIDKWLKVFYKRFFANQFKRSCMPDGPKVGSVNLSPRGDWRMPSDAICTAWTTNIFFDEDSKREIQESEI
jgi:NAD+ synthase (glutamine-hydrolysing)